MIILHDRPPTSTRMSTEVILLKKFQGTQPNFPARIYSQKELDYKEVANAFQSRDICRKKVAGAVC